MERRINVLIITSLFPNSKDPTRSVFSYLIAKELKNLCDVKVIAPLPWLPESGIIKLLPGRFQIPRVPEWEYFDNIEVYHPRYLVIPKISGFAHGLSMYSSLRNLIRRIHIRKKIDVINARWVFPDGFAAALIAEQMRIPFLVSALGCDINLYTKFLLRKPQILYTLNKAGLISTVSIALREEIINLGIPSQKVRCIYNGVDTDIFFPKDQKECRKKLGLDENGKIIIFIGGMDPVKGIEYLIKAVEILGKSGKGDFRLLLIGDGQQRKELEGLAAGLNLNGKIDFVGRKRHEEISDWINASDLLCLPSIREGRPNVVIEALACGKPVVASSVGGVPELVNQKNGILVKPGKPEELAEAIDKALNRKWLTEEISNSIMNLSWRSCAEQFNLAYRMLVE